MSAQIENKIVEKKVVKKVTEEGRRGRPGEAGREGR
jgi:hypothetical protein